MKKRKLFAVIAAVGILFAFGATGFAAGADTKTSEASIEFKAGILELNSVPALDFGAHTIDGTTTQFPMADGTPSMQVADARGNGAGWKVTAALGAFSTTGGATPIESATITLGQGTSRATGTLDTAPTVKQAVTLAANGASDTVATAAVSSGRGTWNVDWTAGNIMIDVPIQHQRTGTHTATLTWTLEDAP
ncbi:WxL domain-containing protein [Christensenella massiliensis]|jgi:hypothetical protein|uniref:WxL domain-containing protein n=1 Tax=Christensenella massiliensis TaxID=1805714 RepID=A0AAU8ABY9_9FIRM